MKDKKMHVCPILLWFMLTLMMCSSLIVVIGMSVVSARIDSINTRIVGYVYVRMRDPVRCSCAIPSYLHVQKCQSIYFCAWNVCHARCLRSIILLLLQFTGITHTRHNIRRLHVACTWGKRETERGRECKRLAYTMSMGRMKHKASAHI